MIRRRRALGAAGDEWSRFVAEQQATMTPEQRELARENALRSQQAKTAQKKNLETAAKLGGGLALLWFLFGRR